MLGIEFPLPGAPPWEAFEERFCAELLEATHAAGGWAPAGALLVASDLSLSSRHPPFLEVVDRGLEFLRDNGVPMIYVPNFALDRWRETHRYDRLGPLDGFASVHLEPVESSLPASGEPRPWVE